MINEYAQKAYDLMQAIPRDDKNNPLTLEGVIRSVLLKSPDTFGYRDDALGLIYCCLGTGISWIDGRLGDHQPNNYINMPPEAGGQGVWATDFGFDESFKIMSLGAAWREEMQDSLRNKHQERLLKAYRTIDNIDFRCQEYNPNEQSWYPISWYACNLCAPRRAQEDFLDGAIETATLIVNTFPAPGTKQWIVHQRTKGRAADILEILMKQKQEIDNE